MAYAHGQGYCFTHPASLALRVALGVIALLLLTGVLSGCVRSPSQQAFLEHGPVRLEPIGAGMASADGEAKAGER